MIQLILATNGLEAMRLSGALLDFPNITTHAASDGRTLLDRLNEAPTFYHLVVLDYGLTSVSGPDCITFIRQLHKRLPILILSDSVEEYRLTELADLGVRKRHILTTPVDPAAFAEWIAFTIDDLGLKD